MKKIAEKIIQNKGLAAESPKAGIILYHTKSGGIELHVDNSQETVWATINQIADIFNVQKSAISKHIKNIYESEELSESSTVSKMETVQKEGSRNVSRNIEYYNLDMLISVGYRVNSKVATEFRKWATQTLKQHVTKGYTINRSKREAPQGASLLSV
jgi:hypothetical protein